MTTVPPPLTPHPAPSDRVPPDSLDEGARALLDRHARRIAADGDDIGVWRDLAQALMDAIPDPLDRLAALEIALARAADIEMALLGVSEVWARARMGVGRRDRSVAERGVWLLTRALARPGPATTRWRPHIHADLAFLFNELGRHDLAERHARLADGCSNALYHLWLAEALFAQGRFERDALCGVDLSPLSDDTLRGLADQVNARPTLKPSGRALILVSVDPVYFKRFALAQILSAHRFGIDFDFHFHLINPDAECLALIERARALTPGLSLGFTAERWNARDPGSDRAYYASSRLLHAARLMRETGATIIIADADIIFRVDPSPLVAETRDFDVTTVEFPGEPLCNRYSASFHVVRPSRMGELYLTAVAHFLAVNCGRHLIWTMDQIALWGVERRLSAMSGGALKLKIWPALVMSVDHQPDAPIWPGGNMAKWEDGPYLRLRDEILRTYGVTMTGEATASPPDVRP